MKHTERCERSVMLSHSDLLCTPEACCNTYICPFSLSVMNQRLNYRGGGANLFPRLLIGRANSCGRAFRLRAPRTISRFHQQGTSRSWCDSPVIMFCEKAAELIRELHRAGDGQLPSFNVRLGEVLPFFSCWPGLRGLERAAKSGGRRSSGYVL